MFQRFAKDPHFNKGHLPHLWRLFFSNEIYTYDLLNCVIFVTGDRMPEELADEFIKEADLNGDGKIDYMGKNWFALLTWFLGKCQWNKNQ